MTRAPSDRTPTDTAGLDACAAPTGADADVLACLDAHRDLDTAADFGRDHALALLAQCSKLARGLTSEDMTRGLPGEAGNTIGSQLRHVLDHHLALLAGVGTGTVDYEARTRRGPCEVDPIALLARIDAAAAGFAALTAGDAARAVRIRRETGICTHSTVARELDFVAAHTTHHLAIVSLLARVLAIGVPPDLGVAAATLAYRRAAGAPDGDA